MIKLKYEAKFLLLNDTSLVNVQVRYPDHSLHPYYFNTDTVRFTPATSSADNTATVDFYPAFLQQINPEGDEYTLIVTGKDKTGNPAEKSMSNNVASEEAVVSLPEAKRDEPIRT